MKTEGYRHPRDKTGECQRMGFNAEKCFLTTMAFRGHAVTPTSKEDNVGGKGDFLIDGKRVEVKSVKRAKRKDSNPNYDLVWIEISNVYSEIGFNGWLYKKTIDVLAFEQRDSFILVDRKVLAAHVEKICDFQTFVSSPDKALYKSYRRFKRRGEHLTIIQVSDLKDIPHREIQKQLGPNDSFYITTKNCVNSDYVAIPDFYTFSFEEARKKREEIVATGEYFEVNIKKW